MTPNAASRWRLQLGEQLGREYARNPQVAAVVVGSSTARGRSDEFSDLDLLVAWRAAPSEADRRRAAEPFASEAVRSYPYDTEYRGWDDMFTVGRDAENRPDSGLSVDVFHVLTETVDERIREVVGESSTREASHHLVSFLHHGLGVHARELVADWQGRIEYTDALAGAMVSRWGQIDYFWRWKSSLARGDNRMMLWQNYVKFSEHLLRTLLALNRRSSSAGAGWTRSWRPSSSGPRTSGIASGTCGRWSPPPWRPSSRA